MMVSLQRQGSVHGEQLRYALGVPLIDREAFTLAEAALSRAVIKFWSNFAASG